MATPAFSFPFAHWASTPLTSPTASAFLSSSLILGLASGEILVYSTSPSLWLRARLTGHRAPIISVAPYSTISESSPHELLFISLSSDGALSKWSLQDCRCLQSVSSRFRRPVGMVIAPQCGVGESRLTDSLVLVYGKATEIVVLNAESLEPVLVWTDHVDWPLPAVLGATGKERECEILTLLGTGDVQTWVLERKRAMKGANVMAVSRRKDTKWSIQWREEWGQCQELLKVKGGYLVLQPQGISLHTITPAFDNGFVEKAEVKTPQGTLKVQVTTDKKSAAVVSEAGDVRIYDVENGLAEVVSITAPEFLHGDRIVDVAVDFDATTGKGKLAVLSRLKTLASTTAEVSLAEFTSIPVNAIWTAKASAKLLDAEESIEPCTASEIFAHMFAVAHADEIHFHTLPTFLLSYHEPTAVNKLPCDGASLCLLKCIRIGEKECLIAGTTSGRIFILDSPTAQPNRTLALFSSPVASARLFPKDLGRRIRNTVLISSRSGTSCIVDIDRGRLMTTFPSHNCSPLSSVSTKVGQNVLALTYRDGVRREWDISTTDGGELLNPSPSTKGGENTTPQKLNDEWYAIDTGPADENGALHLCGHFGEAGLPVASVDIRIVLAELEKATADAKANRRPHERRVNAIHPALVKAKALLTALVPGGATQLLKGVEIDAWDESTWRKAVEECFFRRHRPATLGQIGAGERVSMLTPRTWYEDDEVSPTVTAIVLVTVMAMTSAMLEATGKGEEVDVAALKLLEAHREKQMALGVFAKFWSDANPLIRHTSRQCLDYFMSLFKNSNQQSLVAYWSPFLPTLIPPELSALKEVSRSTALLSKLIADYPCCPVDSKKPVALSAALLLNEQNPIYQDAAIESIGYAWKQMQSHLDPLTTIRRLTQIAHQRPKHPTLETCVLNIATANTPLLASALAAGLPDSAPLITAVATKRPILFSEVLGVIVDSAMTHPLPDLINTLVKAYPAHLAHHAATHRLAFSPPSSSTAIAIYDLKTAAVAHVCEGLRGAPVSMAWQPEGRYFAALGGGEVAVWRVAGGFLGFVTTATTGERDVKIEPRVRKPVPDGKEVRWIADRTMEARGEGGEKVTVTV